VTGFESMCLVEVVRIYVTWSIHESNSNNLGKLACRRVAHAGKSDAINCNLGIAVGEVIILDTKRRIKVKHTWNADKKNKT